MNAVGWLIVAGFFSAATIGCKGGDQPSKIDPFASRANKLSPAEIARGEQACTEYVKQVCECAEQFKSLRGALDAATVDVAEQCKLAAALPEALQTSLGILTSAELSKQDFVEAQDTAQKIAAECITQTARLVSRGCGRNVQSAPSATTTK